MSLRHALLGLLTNHPMTGYDLAKMFDRTAAFVWHAPHSQIYPELRRMNGDGLIEAESSPRGRRGIKRIYSITPTGLAEFERWVKELSVPEQLRDAQRLKACYLEFVSYDTARQFFKAHLEHFEVWERLWSSHAEQLAARATPLILERIAYQGLGDQEPVVAFKVHAYEGLVRQAKLEIGWAREGLRLVDKLEAQANATTT